MHRAHRLKPPPKREETYVKKDCHLHRFSFKSLFSGWRSLSQRSSCTVFNCFYCTVLYAQILLAGNGRDMHLLVTMTYDLSDVYASDWSARRYDLTGDCDSPDTFTDCHGLHRPDYTLDQVNVYFISFL